MNEEVRREREITISDQEYIDLIAARERMYILWNYMTSDDYKSNDVIKLILGIRDVKVNEGGEADA